MIPILGYDTETTGFVNDREAPSHPSQPHLVQLACVLVDLETGRELQSANFIVKPDGWTIPKSSSDVHGITHDMAVAIGVPLRLAVASFANLRAVALATAAHNINFDRVVLDAAMHRLQVTPSSPGPRQHYCTMKLGTDVAKLPPTARMLASGRNHFKSPNLTELHQFLFNEAFADAHNGIADVRACIRCLLDLMKRGAAQPPIIEAM